MIARAVAFGMVSTLVAAAGCGQSPDAIIDEGTQTAEPLFDDLPEVVEQLGNRVHREHLSRNRETPVVPPWTAGVAVPRPPSAPPSSTLSAALADEARSLTALLELPRVLFFPFVIAIAYVISRGIHALTRFALGVGVRRRRLLSTLATLCTLGAWGWAASVIIGRFLRAAPTLSLVGLAVGAAVLLIGFSSQMQNIAAGLGLALRSRVDEGDHVTVGEHTGMVVGVGLTRVQLRNGAGDTLYLPNRRFVEEAVVVGKARHSFPLEVRLARTAPWTADLLERARRVASVSPYRDVNSRVTVRTEGEGGRVLVVQVQVWGARLLASAEQHMRRMLAKHVGEEPPV